MGWGSGVGGAAWWADSLLRVLFPVITLLVCDIDPHPLPSPLKGEGELVGFYFLSAARRCEA